MSNDSAEWSRYLRNKYQLNQYFDVISISGDLKMKKPDERIYRLTAEKLGCQPSDCIYVDDRRYNLGAAQKVGMDAVLFNSRNVEYEGKSVNDFAELAELISRLEKR